MIRASSITLVLALVAGCAAEQAPRPLAPRAPMAWQQPATGELRAVLLSLRRVHFALESASLPPAARDALIEAATVLRFRGDVALTIEGHADTRGANEYNLGLGQRRAATVAEVLSGAGVDRRRLDLVSFGEERPRVEGVDALSHARNRRVEFRLMRGNVELVLDEGDLVDDHGRVLTAFSD